MQGESVLASLGRGDRVLHLRLAVHAEGGAKRRQVGVEVEVHRHRREKAAALTSISLAGRFASCPRQHAGFSPI
jgi:allantoicase